MSRDMTRYETCSTEESRYVMKGLAILGILLLLGGLAALIWPAVTVTHREKAVDIGPIEVTREDKDTIPLPPVFGIVAAATGVALIAISRRRA